jgi:two-component system osmolarity sensor histidine kinase EnvZ
MASTLQGLEATRAEMLAGISHDIRTPLTKLRMAISAPESFDSPVTCAERFIEEIDAIVQQFIDFARGWDGEPSTPGDLNALIEQLAADYAGLGHRFELSLAALPPIAFRPVGMQRLLMNLMHNAVVHGRIGLAVRTGMARGIVTITIEDQGPGVPDEVLSMLKQPFRRGTDADQKSGTGLGLAIADRIAQQHDGTLDLSRNTPHGLKIDMQFPSG